MKPFWWLYIIPKLFQKQYCAGSLFNKMQQLGLALISRLENLWRNVEPCRLDSCAQLFLFNICKCRILHANWPLPHIPWMLNWVNAKQMWWLHHLLEVSRMLLLSNSLSLMTIVHISCWYCYNTWHPWISTNGHEAT